MNSIWAFGAAVLLAVLCVTQALAGQQDVTSGPQYQGDQAAGQRLEQQAAAAYRAGRFAEAGRLFEQSYNAYQHPRSLYNAATAYRRAEQWQKAADLYYRRAQILNPMPVHHLYTCLGICRLHLNQRELANQAFRAYLSMEPNGTYAQQAREAIRTGRWPEEQRRDTSTVQGSRQYYDRADRLYDQRQFRQAAEVSLEGYRRYPNVHELLYNAAICYLDGRLWADAERTFQQYLQTAGADHDALVFMAEAQHEQLNFEDAYQSYQRYLEVEPTGTYADRARDYLHAFAVGDGGSRERPSQDDLRAYADSFVQGEQLFEQGRYDQARRAFEAAYMSVPDRNLYFNMARCDEELRNWRNARTGYEAFLRPGDEGSAAVGHLYLARVLLRENNRSEAQRHVEAFVRRAQQDELPDETANLQWASQLLEECRER